MYLTMFNQFVEILLDIGRYGFDFCIYVNGYCPFSIDITVVEIRVIAILVTTLFLWRKYGRHYTL